MKRILERVNIRDLFFLGGTFSFSPLYFFSLLVSFPLFSFGSDYK